MAFAGTPLYQQLLKQHRLLPLSFNFHSNPYITIILKNYDIEKFYSYYIDFLTSLTKGTNLFKRIKNIPLTTKLAHIFRSGCAKNTLTQVRTIFNEIQKDSCLKDFHSGESNIIPQYYLNETKRTLGKYYSMFSPREHSWFTPDVEYA